MANSDRVIAGNFNPLIVIANVIEILAVVFFLMMALGMSGQSPESRLDALQLVGTFVLIAWLIRRINRVLQFASSILYTLSNRLSRLLTNVAPAGSSDYEPIELKNLCIWHKSSFCIAVGTFSFVTLAVMAVFFTFSLAEGSPVTSTVWDWTYRITVLLLGICFIWMSATLFHARRRCAGKSVCGVE